MKNICLFGASLDVGNLGCRALSFSLLELIFSHQPNARISLIYGNSTGGPRTLIIAGKPHQVEIVNYRLSPRSRLNQHLFLILLAACLYRVIPIRPFRRFIADSFPVLGALESADIVGDIRGGDSFSDIYGFTRLLFGSLPCFVALMLYKDLVFLPQTYGPFQSRGARMIAEFLISHSTTVMSRDRHSLDIIRPWIQDSKWNPAVKFCPDVAFTLPVSEPHLLLFEPEIDRTEHPELIGINISGLLFRGGYTQDNMFGLKANYPDCITRLITALLEQTSCHILLVPHVFTEDIESDVHATDVVFEACQALERERLHVLRGKYDQSEVKAVIGTCDFFIGSRMHACIAALSQSIPAIGIAYSDKFIGVFDSIGLGEFVLDARRLDSDAIVTGCLALQSKRSGAAERLKTQIPFIQKQIHSLFESLLN